MDKGWQKWLYPDLVRCRGFPAQSAWKLMTDIGPRGIERKKAVRRLGKEAERASCLVWSRREELTGSQEIERILAGHHCPTNRTVLWLRVKTFQNLW